uniref:Uncharacterized protein n=1 Tax=Arundo donax TaxID=35708 RepID=A0A0A8ZPF7_ARUDO
MATRSRTETNHAQLIHGPLTQRTNRESNHLQQQAVNNRNNKLHI